MLILGASPLNHALGVLTQLVQDRLALLRVLEVLIESNKDDRDRRIGDHAG